MPKGATLLLFLPSTLPSPSFFLVPRSCVFPAARSIRPRCDNAPVAGGDDQHFGIALACNFKQRRSCPTGVKITPVAKKVQLPEERGVVCCGTETKVTDKILTGEINYRGSLALLSLSLHPSFLSLLSNRTGELTWASPHLGDFIRDPAYLGALSLWTQLMGKSQLPWGQTTLCVCVLVPVCARVCACYKSHSSSPNDFLYCPLYKARNHLRVLRGSGGGVDWTHDNSASSCSLITATSESSADHTAPRTELHRPHVLCASEPPSICFFFCQNL